MMKVLFIIPVILQGLLSVFDEFYLHKKRFIPRWERLGHPVDTLSLLACVLITVLFEPSHKAIAAYIAASLMSCLIITKDEFVHHAYAPPLELWIHAVLFVLHPMVCGAIGMFWYMYPHDPFLWIEAVVLTGYATYQFVYWNFLRNLEQDAKTFR